MAEICPQVQRSYLTIRIVKLRVSVPTKEDFHGIISQPEGYMVEFAGIE
jgi:hypothetical protein